MSESSQQSSLDLHDLGMDRGGHLLVKRELSLLPPGSQLEVYGQCQHLAIHLRAWCRAEGHAFSLDHPEDSSSKNFVGRITRGKAQSDRWVGAVRAGQAKPHNDGAVCEQAPQSWGLAARGALIEAGSPEFNFKINTKVQVWADEAVRLYRQAVSAQWDPETAIDWTAPIDHPDEVEDAVVQIMTYLVENETAALLVPSRFLAQIHPHFREVLQLLAITAADEARHIEVFTRRALLKRDNMALSTAGGQASLKTLVDEPDFALASFLLSVLGEGSFLALLKFLQVYAPDPVTRQVATLTAQDEARHVAFGVAHLRRHVQEDPAELSRLEAAINRRHDALKDTAGLNQEVFDALVLIAAGSWEREAIARGFERVAELKQEMDSGRQRRLMMLGFSEEAAVHLSSLHTRNFM